MTEERLTLCARCSWARGLEGGHASEYEHVDVRVVAGPCDDCGEPAAWGATHLVWRRKDRAACAVDAASERAPPSEPTRPAVAYVLAALCRRCALVDHRALEVAAPVRLDELGCESCGTRNDVQLYKVPPTEGTQS